MAENLEVSTSKNSLSSSNTEEINERPLYKLQNQSEVEFNDNIPPRQTRRLSLYDSRASSLFLDSIGANSKRLTFLLDEVRKPTTSSAPNSPDMSSRASKLNPRNSVYKSEGKQNKDPKILLRKAKNLLNSIKENDDEGNKKIIKEAKSILKKLNKNNFSEATYLLGTWKEYGLFNTSVNKAKAYGLYTTASKLGYPPAIDKVAYKFEMNKEYTPAVAYYKKAAALGDPAANYRLGIAFIFGELKLTPKQSTALFYLRRSAVHADITFPQGAYIMALICFGIYEVDLGLRDNNEGKEYLNKAANLGYEPAQYKLGNYYEFGEYGYPINSELSIKYYNKAAIKGHSESQMSLSGWYLTGAPNILEQNDSLAFKWCSKSAMKNFNKAQFAMGYYYEVGVGVNIDMNKAMEWYKKAAENGSNDAKKRLEKSQPGFNKDQLNLAKKDKKKNDCLIS